MKQEDYNEKRKRLAELEEELIHRAAEIGDKIFMYLFLDWQELRQELNANAVKVMEELFKKVEKEIEEEK